MAGGPPRHTAGRGPSTAKSASKADDASAALREWAGPAAFTGPWPGWGPWGQEGGHGDRGLGFDFAGARVGLTRTKHAGGAWGTAGV